MVAKVLDNINSGLVSVHYWTNICATTLASVRRHPLFPSKPDLEGVISVLQQRYFAENYAQRIFGYFHPPREALYAFGISCHLTCELRLSLDGQLINAVTLVAGRNLTRSQCFARSQNVYLRPGSKYFFEVLHLHTVGADHLQVVYFINDEGNPHLFGGDVVSPHRRRPELDYPNLVVANDLGLAQALGSDQYQRVSLG